MKTKGKTTKDTTSKTQKKNPVYVSLTPLEMDKLREAGYFALRLYMELKWMASFKTGRVAANPFVRNITYAELGRRVSLPSKQGRSSAASQFDSTQAKRMLDELEALGLVRDITRDAKGQLAFWLPLSPLRTQGTDQEESQEGPSTIQTQAPMAEVPSLPDATRVMVTQEQAASDQAAEETEEDDWDDMEDVEPTPVNAVKASQLLSDDAAFEEALFRGEILYEPPSPSVLTNTDSQDIISVHEPVLVDAKASTPLPEELGQRPSDKLWLRLTPEQIQERLVTSFPAFLYLNNPVSLRLYEMMAGMDVGKDELDTAAQQILTSATEEPTPSQLLRHIKQMREEGKRRALRARVAL